VWWVIIITEKFLIHILLEILQQMADLEEMEGMEEMEVLAHRVLGELEALVLLEVLEAPFLLVE
jgi:hypothetical protein